MLNAGSNKWFPRLIAVRKCSCAWRALSYDFVAISLLFEINKVSAYFCCHVSIRFHSLTQYNNSVNIIKTPAADVATKLTIDVDLITGALGKLKDTPIFTILYEGELAAAAPTQTRVGLLMFRSYVSPPTYSALRLQSGGLPAPSNVLHFAREIMKRHSSIAMQMAGVPRALKFFRY